MSSEETDQTSTATFRVEFDRKGRTPPTPPPRIFRILRLAADQTGGRHGGPLYGSADAVAAETKAESTDEFCCWWGNALITEDTHDMVGFRPAASWEEDEGPAA